MSTTNTHSRTTSKGRKPVARIRIADRVLDREAIDHVAERNASYAVAGRGTFLARAKRDIHVVRGDVFDRSVELEYAVLTAGSVFTIDSTSDAGFNGVIFHASFVGGWRVPGCSLGAVEAVAS